MAGRNSRSCRTEQIIGKIKDTFEEAYLECGTERDNYQIRSVAQSCPTLCDPMNRSTPGLPVITNSRSSLKFLFIELGNTHPEKRIFMKNVQKCNQKPKEEIKY